MAQTERQLGLPIPEPLRSYYTELANGGFGPCYGILGVQGGYVGSMGTIDEALGNLFDLEIGNLEEALALGETTTTDLDHHTYHVLTHFDLVSRGCGTCDEMNIRTGRIYYTEITAESETSIQFIAEGLDAYLATWLAQVDERYKEDYRIMRAMHLDSLSNER